MYNYQQLVEKIFVIISLFFYTGAISPFIPETNTLYPVKEALPNIGLVITLLLICARWERVINIIVREKLLWILLVIAVASPLWSDIPTITLEEILPLIRVTIFGVYLATAFRISEQLRLLAWMFSIVVVLCLLFGLVLKSYGVVGMGYVGNMEDVVHTGAWRGIYVHKTFLGTIMCLSSLVFLFNTVIERRYRLFMSVGFVLSIYVLLCSTTKAALGVLLFMMMILPIYKAFRWNYNILLPLWTFLLFLFGIILIFIINSAETIVTSIGKDITISGRTDVWPLIIEKVGERPWFGYGYLSFWYGGWDSQVADIWRELKWGFEPPHAHNGFLEICLSIGIVGLSLFLFSFLNYIFRAFRWLRIIKTAEGLVPIVYFTFSLLVNFTESDFMRGDIYWLLHVSMIISMLNRNKKYLISEQLLLSSNIRYKYII